MPYRPTITRTVLVLFLLGTAHSCSPAAHAQAPRDLVINGVYEAALDIPRIILHHGYVPHTSYPTGWLKRITQFWKELLADLPGEMQFHLENHLEHDPQLISNVIDSIGDSRVTVCLDIGHAHCHGRIPVEEWPQRLGARIGYVHLHDNHGESDEHLAFGEGTLDVAAVLTALEEYCPDAIWAPTRESMTVSSLGSGPPSTCSTWRCRKRRSVGWIVISGPRPCGNLICL